MDCVVICLESFLKRLVPYALELAEPFADDAIGSRVRTLLGKTLDLECPVNNAGDEQMTKLYLFALI